uniref:Uncharacterized protein n=1 Tax=Panagrolaimus sp. ES5 TaxID=591445 RepID=A0AC34FD79_9BILA
MFCLLSTLRKSLIYFLLLWTLISSLPTSSNLNLHQQYINRRRLQRDTSNEFIQNEPLDLVLQNNLLEFQICCANSGGCYPGDFLFCFETKKQTQGSNLLFGCGDGTCAYNIEFKSYDVYALLGSEFSTTDKCFNGKITNDKISVSHSGINYGIPGCPLAIESGNRLKIHVRSIPYGVTVTATNAQKYVEPTTSTSSPQNSNETIPQTELEKEDGMSDGLKYGLIGIGVLVFLLIVGGEPTTKPSAEPEPPQQYPSKEPSVVPPSAAPSKPPPELPKANITLAELITRAERNRHRGKLGDTFDRLKKPAFENIFESMIRHKWISENEALVLKEKHPRPPSEDELLLFSLPIGDMFLKLERMINVAKLHTFSSPNNSECTKSAGSKGKPGQSVATENGGGSSSSKASKTSVSKEIVVAEKKKAKRKR